jgi:hypothetical protein
MPVTGATISPVHRTEKLSAGTLVAGDPLHQKSTDASVRVVTNVPKLTPL